MLVCLSAQCPGKINFYCWAMLCIKEHIRFNIFKAYIESGMINWSYPTPCSRAGSALTCTLFKLATMFKECVLAQ